MANHTINIPRYTDSYWIDFLEKNEETFSLSGITCHAMPGISGSIKDEIILKLKIINVYSLYYISFKCSSVDFRFYRGESSTKYGVFDRIEISYTTQLTNDLNLVHNLVICLQEYFKDSCILPSSNDESSISDLYISTISQLQNVNSKLIEFQTEIKKELEDQYKRKDSVLCEEYEGKVKQLASQKESFENEYLRKQEALLERESLLNDRENVHARRKMRDDIVEKLRTQIDTSQRTFFSSGYTVVIVYVIVFAICVMGFVLNYSFYNPIDALSEYRVALKSGDQGASLLPFVYTAAKQVLCLSVILFFLIVFLRWALEQHSGILEYRKEKNKYLVDMDRANWIVEAALEWKKQNDVEIPQYIVQELLTGLFVNENDKNQTQKIQHPAERLFEILMDSKAMLKLKLPNDAGEAEISAHDLLKKVKK